MNLFKKVFNILIIIVAFGFALNILLVLSDEAEFLAKSNRGVFAESLLSYRKRLAGVKKDLSLAENTDTKKLGYISDIGDFYFVQYDFAPKNVYSSTDCKYVIGDFYKNLPSAKFFADKGLIIVKNYGNGVLLLLNKGVK